jgi:hypothetical protein
MKASTQRVRGMGLAIAVCAGGLLSRALAADVIFRIDPAAARHAISPYIYGINPSRPNEGLDHPRYQSLHLALERLGGNRWTAYNWKTNASNAGTDYRLSNDHYLDASTVPGDAVKAALLDAQGEAGRAVIVTIPINGFVAADESGPVPPHILPRNSPHFVPEYPSKTDDPQPAANHVYQDEFVRWLDDHFAGGLWRDHSYSIFLMLDNEPDLWASTHPEVHPSHPTYLEVVSKTLAYARAIKLVVPEALIFGPASYGWNGFMTLQNAVDAAADNAAINPGTGQAYGNFLSYYLAQMSRAEHETGKRLLDVLDVHWYPEAMGPNASGALTRIDSVDASPGITSARMEAPRSLWDETYVEKSWITRDSLRGKAIALLPRLQRMIADNYPGTKLSISEYNLGGGTDISGAIAEADVLGLLGRYGVYAAAEWPMAGNEKYILGAIRMFRNFDGVKDAFGDVSVSSVTSDPADTSVYASVDSSQPGRTVLVAINRTNKPLTAQFTIAGTISSPLASIFQMTAQSAQTLDGLSVLPTPRGLAAVSELKHYVMPPQSVSTIELMLGN